MNTKNFYEVKCNNDNAHNNIFYILLLIQLTLNTYREYRSNILFYLKIVKSKIFSFLIGGVTSMPKHYMSILIFLLLSFSGLMLSHSENTSKVKVTCEIVKKFDEQDPEDRIIATEISLGKKEIVKLFGLVKTENMVKQDKSQFFYLEWTYDDGTGEVVLENSEKNPNYEFAPSIVTLINYYYVTKRIRKPGNYYFKVLKKQGDKRILAADPARLIVSRSKEVSP